jgi:protein-S-isoprenylcysteine O-methyltransferase Ste14
MAGLRREVALLALPVLALAAAILCHLIHAAPATTTWITAAATAAGTVVVTALAIPRHPQLIGGSVITLFTILAHYWWHLSTDMLSPAVVVISLLFGMPLSNRITPVVPAPPAPPAA